MNISDDKIPRIWTRFAASANGAGGEEFFR
jgi:hypothetical protein